jgi:hypothetical protein
MIFRHIGSVARLTALALLFVQSNAPAHAQKQPQAAPGSLSAKNAKDAPASSSGKDKGEGSPPKRQSPKPVPSSAPYVISKAAADARRPKSPLLAPPGSIATGPDRYNLEPVDWSEIPPWRQTSFFGIWARGQFFIYVVDQSGSMLDDDRLARAKIELRRSVFALQPPQSFEVIFYNEQATPMPGGPFPRSADQRNKDQLSAWLRLIGPDGGTEPKSAVIQALALAPDAVFLLSDGEYPKGTVEAIARANSRKIPIHCIDMTGGIAGDHLQRIARDSGGQYASRPGSLEVSP